MDVIAKDEPWEFTVRNGHSLAVKSARGILRLFLECSEHETYPALPSLVGPLHAMGVLAVFLATRPESRMANMDRELLKAAAMAIRDAQTYSRVQKELGFAVNGLESLVTEATRPRDDGGLRSSQRSPAQSPREFTRRDQSSGSLGKPRRVSEINAPTTQANGESLEERSGEGMGNLERDDNLDYSQWWAEDESPMIMDEFGWNWANFSQLLHVHDNEPHILL